MCALKLTSSFRALTGNYESYFYDRIHTQITFPTYHEAFYVILNVELKVISVCLNILGPPVMSSFLTNGIRINPHACSART